MDKFGKCKVLWCTLGWIEGLPPWNILISPLKTWSSLPVYILRYCDVCVCSRWQILPQLYSRHWFLVTSARVCFTIFRWNAVCPCTHLSAGSGYVLTSHCVGGEIILPMSQVYSTVDRSSICFLTLVARGSQDLATSPKLQWSFSPWCARHLLGHTELANCTYYFPGCRRP